MNTKILTLIGSSIAFINLTVWAADPPHLVPFQGHLARPSTTDPTRFEPVPSGRYDILFTLYVAPVGGESKVWGPERHAQVTVVNGLVNALLGSVLGFENTLASQPNFFRRPLYVGITIDADGNPNTADLELIPRQVLLPAVQALNANTLDGADWRTFFIGTDADATFTPGTTKARDADLFDGIDSAAVFVDPSNTSSPKVRIAQVADAISGALTVEGLLKSVVGTQEFFMVPKGAIIMWSGNALPNGWALCDGQNGTPDLRGKFVRGAPGLGPYASGGSDTHIHTSPAHLHSVDPPARTTSNNSGTGFTAGNAFVSQEASRHTHTHTVDIPAFDSATTAVTIDPASNVPAHFTLAYIMKL
jgi:hypothetical protein